MADRSGLIAQLCRFGLTGAANTLAGAAVITGLDIGAHVDPRLANAAGFAVGLTLSFALSRKFVFRSGRDVASTVPRYLIAAGACFALNQIVLTTTLGILGHAAGARLLAQALAMISYSTAFFGLCRLWVFHTPAPPAAVPIEAPAR